MSKYTATVIKTGNSYALRVPKEYINVKQLKLGQKVKLADEPTLSQGYNREAFWQAMRELQALSNKHGSLKSIKDPVAWQREIRKDRPLPGRE